MEGREAEHFPGAGLSKRRPDGIDADGVNDEHRNGHDDEPEGNDARGNGGRADEPAWWLI